MVASSTSCKEIKTSTTSFEKNSVAKYNPSVAFRWNAEREIEILSSRLVPSIRPKNIIKSKMTKTKSTVPRKE